MPPVEAFFSISQQEEHQWQARSSSGGGTGNERPGKEVNRDDGGVSRSTKGGKEVRNGAVEPEARAVGTCSVQMETGSGFKRACGRPVREIEVEVPGLGIKMPKYICDDGHEHVPAVR